MKTEQIREGELRSTAHRLRRLRVQAVALLLWVVVRNGALLIVAAALAIAVFILAPFAMLSRFIDVDGLPLLTYILTQGGFGSSPTWYGHV